MDQHMIKEIQTLKHEVQHLKEAHGYGDAMRMLNRSIQDLEQQFMELDQRISQLEGGAPESEDTGPIRATGPRLQRDTGSADQPSSGVPRGAGRW
jgi:predicted RNase H-like nuclease (RuvC/YqgF family)